MRSVSGKVLISAFLLWITGFIWGIVVFTVPALRQVPSIQYVSKFPAVSYVLIPLYAAILYFMARRRLNITNNKMREGLKFGLTLAIVNILLDILVYVILFGSADYFEYLSIWIAYSLFVAVPWLVGYELRKV